MADRRPINPHVNVPKPGGGTQPRDRNIDGSIRKKRSDKTQNIELNDQIKQLNTEVIELSKTVTRLESSQESKQELIDELKTNKQSIQEQNQQLDRDLRAIQQERNTLQVSLSDLKSTNSTNTQRLEQSQSEVVELKTNIKQHVEIIKHYESLYSQENKNK